jgi:hypothetical protein
MHTPSHWILILSLVICALALLATFVAIPVVSPHAIYVALLGYAVLVIGVFFKTT